MWLLGYMIQGTVLSRGSPTKIFRDNIYPDKDESYKSWPIALKDEGISTRQGQQMVVHKDGSGLSRSVCTNICLAFCIFLSA
jgi:hypothetical protein